MRRPLARAILAALSILPVSLLAQQAPMRDPQALTILHSALAVMGGAGAAAIQDTVTKATTFWPSNSTVSPVSSTISTKGADRIRVDNSSGGQTVSVVYNGGRLLHSTATGWSVGPSANSRFRRVDHLPALLLASELARGNFAATYIGQESVGSQRAVHVTLSRISSNVGNGLDAKFTKDSEIEVFIDPATFLILKVSYIYFSKIDWRIGSPMEIYYSDYRSVGGMMVPFIQRTVFNGSPLYELHLTSVAFNQGVADTTFGVK